MAAILDFRRPISYSFYKTIFKTKQSQELARTSQNQTSMYRFETIFLQSGRHFELEAKIEMAPTPIVDMGCDP